MSGQKGIPVYLESACFDSARFSRVLPSIDLVKIEFKTRDSGFVDDGHYPDLVKNALECLRLSVTSKKDTYIKVVVSSRTTGEDMAEAGRAGIRRHRGRRHLRFCHSAGIRGRQSRP